MSPPLAYDTLLKTIGGHDWGLVGNHTPCPEWSHALPNKLFEYMAACVPIVCWNADEVWRFIKDTGMGIRIDSLEELKDRWKEHRACRKAIVAHRQQYALEAYLPRLESVYHQVTNDPGRGVQDTLSQTSYSEVNT